MVEHRNENRCTEKGKNSFTFTCITPFPSKQSTARDPFSPQVLQWGKRRVVTVWFPQPCFMLPERLALVVLQPERSLRKPVWLDFFGVSSNNKKRAGTLNNQHMDLKSWPVVPSSRVSHRPKQEACQPETLPASPPPDSSSWPA